MKSIFLLFLIAVVLAVQPGACSRAEREVGADGKDDISDNAAKERAARAIESAIEKESRGGVRVDITGDNLEIEDQSAGKDYSFAAGGKVALPKTFPEEVPLYPGYSLKMAQQVSYRDIAVILGTQGAPGRVLDYYRDEMAKRGWKGLSETDIGTEKYRNYEKDGDMLVLIVSPGFGETIISLSYRRKK